MEDLIHSPSHKVYLFLKGSQLMSSEEYSHEVFTQVAVVSRRVAQRPFDEIAVGPFPL